MREEMRFRRDNVTGEWTLIGPIEAQSKAWQEKGRPPPIPSPMRLIDGEPVWSITNCSRWAKGEPRPDFV